MMNKKKLYLFILAACAAGYAWLYLNLQTTGTDTNVQVCMFRHISGVPCPSCGSTRSILSLLHGDWLQALYWNPIGLLLTGILLVVPVWIITDLLRGSSSFYTFYRRAEALLRRPKVALPLIALVVCNWLWNIIKGL